MYTHLVYVQNHVHACFTCTIYVHIHTYAHIYLFSFSGGLPLQSSQSRSRLRQELYSELCANTRRESVTLDPTRSTPLEPSDVSWDLFPRFAKWLDCMQDYCGVDQDYVEKVCQETMKTATVIANTIYKSLIQRLCRRNSYAWHVMKGLSVFDPSEYKTFSKTPTLAVKRLKKLAELMPKLLTIDTPERPSTCLKIATVLNEARAYFHRITAGYEAPLDAGTKRIVDITDHYKGLKIVFNTEYGSFIDFALNAISFLGTSVMIEDTFSLSGLVKSKRRSLLQNVKVDARRRLSAPSVPRVANIIKRLKKERGGMGTKLVDEMKQYRTAKEVRQVFGNRSRRNLFSETKEVKLLSETQLEEVRSRTLSTEQHVSMDKK